jgi:hypothetical protein
MRRGRTLTQPAAAFFFAGVKIVALRRYGPDAPISPDRAHVPRPDV